MIRIPIPGRSDLELRALVLDFNGTLALDGSLLEGVPQRLDELAKHLDIVIITADTHGHARERCQGLRARLHLLTQDQGGPEKESLVASLGAQHVVALGNGANDAAMLEYAELGIAVLGPEGASAAVLRSADVLVRDVRDGLDLLRFPARLVATLRP